LLRVQGFQCTPQSRQISGCGLNPEIGILCELGCAIDHSGLSAHYQVLYASFFKRAQHALERPFGGFVLHACLARSFAPIAGLPHPGDLPETDSAIAAIVPFRQPLFPLRQGYQYYYSLGFVCSFLRSLKRFQKSKGIKFYNEIMPAGRKNSPTADFHS
jgi:hypothetical protein